LKKTKKNFIERPYLGRFVGIIVIFINEPKDIILTYKGRIQYELRREDIHFK